MCVYVCVYVCSCVCMYACICVHVFMHVHVAYMCVCVCVCVCVYMFMWEVLMCHEGGHACVDAHMCGGQGTTLRHGLPLNLGSPIPLAAWSHTVGTTGMHCLAGSLSACAGTPRSVLTLAWQVL